MKIVWEKIDDKTGSLIEGWMSKEDRHNLCMEKKSWQQTANDIAECLRYMDKAEFRNAIGYIGGRAMVAIMLGVENDGRLLNIYNIIVSPEFRYLHYGKDAVVDVIGKNNALCLDSKYTKVKVSALPTNKSARKFFNDLGFDECGFDGKYDVFEKRIEREYNYGLKK